MDKKVLLIEDNETTNFIHRLVLKNAGFEMVDEVLNGLDAFDYLEKSCPDIIFLDINMPIMSGWEFLKEREIKGFCDKTKIAMLSTSTRLEDKKKAKEHKSVIAYFEKPLTKEHIEELKEKIFG